MEDRLREILEETKPITRPKKAAAPQQMPATPKQLPTPKRTAQPSSNATPKQTDAASPAVRQTALAHRNKDGSLYKHASAPGALPARQQPSEAQQLRGLPTRAAAFAIPAAQRVPSGQPKQGSAPFSFLAPPSQQEQELRSVLLSKWAGPGFSLPPTPEALPMPSASLLASKKKKGS
ncbi:hypothetical protein COCSUDRAFT_60166 [Coccomyxa subellipsoidea C-169]|uniref:Uncharacterized protein n=1 Tax=Coccomyxa subellipsoidea (strain C-169) TaxID=574566 RepID=I0YJD0_COCSC|nr:hypothetical protein COCSUDRAFT_60166 [Coccomyxa subellipsoidea C-169]EIE18499.1 hypothetical protein COCSUDRAFT_60166 [Coccomyxa subellipsoidea C-169]|eukprot:XP_005643043.1 hypothetical protein COCSUDRAFT_60166 [Coccomyxa subellipsoidea C-169]